MPAVSYCCCMVMILPISTKIIQTRFSASFLSLNLKLLPMKIRHSDLSIRAWRELPPRCHSCWNKPLIHCILSSAVSFDIIQGDMQSCVFPMLFWPHDHKLRKYLSLKLDFEYLKFYWTQCFNNFQIRTNCTYFEKFWFINKTNAKVTLVWNFDLRIFSVYGLRAWARYWYTSRCTLFPTLRCIYILSHII